MQIFAELQNLKKTSLSSFLFFSDQENSSFEVVK